MNLNPDANIGTDHSPTDVRQISDEEKKIERAFMKRAIVVLTIGAVVIYVVALAFLRADIWMAVWGFLAGFLLLGAVPLMIEEYPFFSTRATRFALWFTFPVWFILLFTMTFTAQALHAIYPITLTQGAYFIAQVTTLLPPLGTMGITLVRWVLGSRKRVEIAIPKWVTLRAFGLGYPASWAISSPEIMKRSGGVPIAIINHTKRTLVLTMIWLEWFAPLWIPEGFHREFVLQRRVGLKSCTYHHKVIELEKMLVVKPKDAVTWVLRWDEARSLLEELLREGVVEPRDEVPIRITVYDEYTDRVHSSREIPLLAVLSEHEHLRIFESLNK